MFSLRSLQRSRLNAATLHGYSKVSNGGDMPVTSCIDECVEYFENGVKHLNPHIEAEGKLDYLKGFN